MGGRIWLTSDTHFGHGNIIKYENRPFQDAAYLESGDTGRMDSEIVKRWNQVVAKDDKVFHLGDVGFCGKDRMAALVKSLHGRKTLILGNHDRGRNPQWWQDVGFDEVSRYPIIIEEFVVLQHEPPAYFNSATPFYFVYGHVHGTGLYKTVTKSAACVCVERWGYKPVNFEEIRELAKLAE